MATSGHPVGELDLVPELVEVASTELWIERPADLDALVDDQAFHHDEFIPYWAELWPSGRALAESLPDPPPRTIVEIGAGLGLPSLVAARRGAAVTATDWSPDAVAMLRRNAARNNVSLEAHVADWRQAAWFLERGPWQLVLAADVLYERRHLEPLLELLPLLGPAVLLADPGRPALGDFLEAAEDQWEIDDAGPGVLRLTGRGGR